MMDIQNVSLSKIKLGNNSRLDVTEEEISGLMRSIKEEGLLQPIGIAKTRGRNYQIVYGNRRFMAYSKLGLKTIPAVIVKDSKQSDIDIKNLVENIQRKNISLKEVGRYINHLESTGLKASEIAVRLGVSPGYIYSAKQSFDKIPKKFSKDVDVSVGAFGPGGRTKKGKMSLRAVRSIERTIKTNPRLGVKGKNKLYELAKTQGFNSDMTDDYAHLIKENPNLSNSAIIQKGASGKKTVTVNFTLTTDEYNRVYNKHIENGPFKHMNQVFRAALTGKINEKIKITR